jgi:hypothetical protein
MTAGFIYGYRHKLEWLPLTKKLLMGTWAVGSIKLGTGGLTERSRVGSFLCKDCHKIIIDTGPIIDI